MNAISNPSKHLAHRSIIWFSLFLAAMIALLSLSRPTTAQERQVDLIMRLVTHSDDIETAAGEESVFYLELSNIGNKSISNVMLSAEAPKGWEINFTPAEISYLGAGSIQTVDVRIRPPEQVTKREYQISLHATADEIRKVHEFWVSVKSPRWLEIGAGVVIVMIAVFVALFLIQNRQD